MVVQGLRARTIAEAALLVDAVRLGDLDVDEAGGGERALELVAGERAGDAAGPCGHVGAVAASMSGSAMTSETAKRPPGRRTRAASRSTASLSPERLMTQLEITTSTDASGSGTSSIVPLRNSTFAGARLGGVAAGELEHLVGHVQPDRAARRADPPRGDEHVGAGARAEVEHRLALVQVGDRGRHAAAERRLDRGLGRPVGLAGVVQRLAEDLAGRAAAASPRPRAAAAYRSRTCSRMVSVVSVLMGPTVPTTSTVVDVVRGNYNDARRLKYRPATMAGTRIGINGFGRMGRLALRAALGLAGARVRARQRARTATRRPPRTC